MVRRTYESNFYLTTLVLDRLRLQGVSLLVSDVVSDDMDDSGGNPTGLPFILTCFEDVLQDPAVGLVDMVRFTMGDKPVDLSSYMNRVESGDLVPPLMISFVPPEEYHFPCMCDVPTETRKSPNGHPLVAGRGQKHSGVKFRPRR